MTAMDAAVELYSTANGRVDEARHLLKRSQQFFPAERRQAIHQLALITEAQEALASAKRMVATADHLLDEERVDQLYQD